jgi:isocitrate dehydrogenase
MSKIIIKNGVLNVPDTPTIPYIPGDGIGPEVWQATQKVLDTAIETTYHKKRHIEWIPLKAGQEGMLKTGSPLPDETIKMLKEYKVAIKSPLETPVGGGIRSINVAIRKALDLYACIRPIRYFEGVPAPVKHPEHVNMVIFRENTEDIYTGIEWAYDDKNCQKLIKELQDHYDITQIRFPKTTAIGIKCISKEGSERLIHAAIDYAIEHNLPKVTITHKGNIMKFTEGAFRDWGYDYAVTTFDTKVFTMKQYNSILTTTGKEAAEHALSAAKSRKKVIIDDCITDAFFQNALLHPKEYSVIAACNLNGDYISDALAAQVGGIGISPGANINYQTGHAVFEATHGTAPSIAGQNKANPSALILSGAMMLHYIGWEEAAKRIEAAIQKTISNHILTADFQDESSKSDSPKDESSKDKSSPIKNATIVGTIEFTEAILKELSS